jgi:hypothetical protein
MDRPFCKLDKLGQNLSKRSDSQGAMKLGTLSVLLLTGKMGYDRGLFGGGGLWGRRLGVC